MKSKILIILLCSLLLTGCYNYRELNDLAIASAIGISKEKDEIKLTLQIYDTQKKDSKEQSESKFVVYTTTGKTVQEAIRNILNITSKKIYTNHLQVLLIDEEIAKNDIKEIIDFFFRDPESRKQFRTLISKGDIEEILTNKTLLESVNGQSIKKQLISNQNFLGNINNITFAKTINDYINPNKEIYLPIIELEETKSEDEKIEQKKKIIIKQSGIFKNNKMVGYINDLDVLYANMIANKIDTTILTYPSEGLENSIEIIDCKSKVKSKSNKISIQIKLNGNITDYNGKEDLKDKKTIENINKDASEYINKQICDSVNKIIKNYDSDIYGFKDMVYKNDNKYFKENKIELKDLDIKIDTVINLSAKGNGVDNINEIKKN